MHSQKAPAGYQPTYQGQADQGMWDAMGYLGSAGKGLADSAIPAFANITKATQNNPYYSGAQQGADAASKIGMDYVAPSQFQMAQSSMDRGDTLGNYGNLSASRGMADYNKATSLLPQIWSTFGQGDATAAGLMDMAGKTSQGWQYADPALQDQWSKGQQVYGEGQALGAATIPNLINASNQVYDTAFDPQRALYDRSYQQMMEHTNAIAAQNGVAGSPFAAGVAGDAARNFDIDWANNQLSRQISGLGAMNSGYQGAGSLFGNVINGSAGAYGSLMQGGVNAYDALNSTAASNYGSLASQAFSAQQTAQNNATQNYARMLGAGTDAKSAGTFDLANLTNGQLNAYGAASDLGAAGLNTMTTAAMYPNQVYINNLNQILSALGAQVDGTNASLGPLQQLIGDYSNYMQLGQSATRNAQQAAQINNAAAASSMGGIAGLAGLALAPFTGGMSLAMTGGMGGGAVPGVSRGGM